MDDTATLSEYALRIKHIVCNCAMKVLVRDKSLIQKPFKTLARTLIIEEVQMSC
jgi:hypothetical protein